MGSRMMNARTLWIPACVLALTYGVCAAEGGDLLQLARGGESAYTVVIGKDAEEPVPTAAKDFVHFFKEITGAELSIVTDDEAMGEREIMIGPSKHVEREPSTGAGLNPPATARYARPRAVTSIRLPAGTSRAVQAGAARPSTRTVAEPVTAHVVRCGTSTPIDPVISREASSAAPPVTLVAASWANRSYAPPTGTPLAT